MDPILERRLKRDPDFKKTLAKMVKDHLDLGRQSLDYWVDEYDAAHDTMMTYASLSRQDFDSLSKGHPRRFILPMTATHITTMATYIAQVLFGQDTPHKVEGRGPGDDVPAEHMNTLLKWNAEQQPTYFLGYSWVMDALVYNRGIFYNQWKPLYKNLVEAQEVADPESPETKAIRPKFTQEEYGGYCHMDLISPYDWVCDPEFPIHRFQEGRFTGHKLQISWIELKRRSKLPVDHPDYVMPSAVEELSATRKPQGIATSPSGSASSPSTAIGRNDTRLSRTAYERQRSKAPNGMNKADSKDSGVVECHELWVKIIPSQYGIDNTDYPVLFRVLVGNGNIVLSVEYSTYMHREFPYSVSEARPSAYYQFSPSWATLLKGIQDYIDWLKNRHQEALSRTIGNIFIANPEAVDLDDFMNPEKEGLIIPLKPDATGRSIRDVIQQVPLTDMTRNFNTEVSEFIQYAESVTGANSSMQGMLEGDTSATEYAGTQQMAAGRMSSVARLLSVTGIVPQTRQFVTLFQQFLNHSMSLRFSSPRTDLPPELKGTEHLKVDPDTIQGSFDFIASDGTLAGPDAKKVAGITRVLETAQGFPDVFVPAPGNINVRKLIFEGMKGSGLRVEDYLYTNEMLERMGLGQPPAGPSPEQPAGATPGPTPEQLALPSLGDPADQVASADAPVAHPGNT